MGLVFSVICPQFLVFPVKLANFLMFTVPEMFGGFFGHLRQGSDLFVSLRKSSTVFGNRR